MAGHVGHISVVGGEAPAPAGVRLRLRGPLSVAKRCAAVFTASAAENVCIEVPTIGGTKLLSSPILWDSYLPTAVFVCFSPFLALATVVKHSRTAALCGMAALAGTAMVVCRRGQEEPGVAHQGEDLQPAMHEGVTTVLAVPQPVGEDNGPVPLHPLVMAGLSFAGKVAAGWVVHDWLRLSAPTAGELEAVPLSLSRRLRRRVPDVTVQDWLCPPADQVEDAHETLPQWVWGTGTVALDDSHSNVTEAKEVLAKLQRAADELLPMLHSQQPEVVQRHQRLWEGRHIELAVVDASSAAGGLGLGGEVFKIRGAAYGKLIALSEEVARGPQLAGVLAHELTHLLLRHSAECEDGVCRRQLWFAVRSAMQMTAGPGLWRLLGFALGTAPQACMIEPHGAGGAVAQAGYSALLEVGLSSLASCAREWRLSRPGMPHAAGSLLGSTLVAEIEAEQMALVLMAKAGFDPRTHLALRHPTQDFYRYVGTAIGNVEAGLEWLSKCDSHLLSHINAIECIAWWPSQKRAAWCMAHAFPAAWELYLASLGDAEPGLAPWEAREKAGERAG